MNDAGGDAVLVIGDTAAFDGDALEQCLSRFAISGPRLFVAGNHELWTAGHDSYRLYTHELPGRVRALGWHWLEGEPFVAGDAAIVGSLGWYDYSFAQPRAGDSPAILRAQDFPRRRRPRATVRPLLEAARRRFRRGMSVVARWNDGRFVKLDRSDETFLNERLRSCARTSARRHRAAGDRRGAPPAVPSAPAPAPSAQWDFAKAYLGSDAHRRDAAGASQRHRSLLRSQPLRRRGAGRAHPRGEPWKRLSHQGVSSGGDLSA